MADFGDCSATLVIGTNSDAEKRRVVSKAFEVGGMPQEGTAVTKVLPPVSRLAKGNPPAEKCHHVKKLLARFYEHFPTSTEYRPVEK